MATRTITSGDDRWAKWDARFQTGSQSVSPAMTRLMAGNLSQNVKTTFNEIVAMEGEVRQVLNAEGVSVITYPFYLNFGRELWKMSGRITGESAAIEAATLIGKWVSRGLTQSVLEAIRTQVFNIVAPTP